MANLYLIEPVPVSSIPPFKEYLGYGTYDNAVVCARSEAEAKCLHPDGDLIFTNGRFVHKESGYFLPSGDFSGWVHPDDVQVTLIGVASNHIKSGTVVRASYTER